MSESLNTAKCQNSLKLEDAEFGSFVKINNWKMASTESVRILKN